MAIAIIGPDTIAAVKPRNKKEQRKIKPVGFQFDKYPTIVTSKPPYLYNRCHLIAHQLGGQEKEENLITGTHYMNTAMETYETKVAKYIKKTKNHVLYRATPIYDGDEVIALGIQVEAYSIEDKGTLQFNKFFYNIQPGIEIDYSSGNNSITDKTIENEDMLPFAVQNPSDSDSDLMYEMKKHLEVLFEDQKNSDSYSRMKNMLDTIADGARKVEIADKNTAKGYMKLKEYEYEYVNALKDHVPLLLKKEDFFKDVFYN